MSINKLGFPKWIEDEELGDISVISHTQVLILLDWLVENEDKVLWTECEKTLAEVVDSYKESISTNPSRKFHIYKWKGYHGIGWWKPRFLVKEGDLP